MDYRLGDIFIIKKAFTLVNFRKLFTQKEYYLFRMMPTNKNLKKGKEIVFLSKETRQTWMGNNYEYKMYYKFSGEFARTIRGQEYKYQCTFLVPQEIASALLIYTGKVKQLEFEYDEV